MRVVNLKDESEIKVIVGKGFTYSIDSSARQHGVYTGIEDFIEIHVEGVSSAYQTKVGGRVLNVYPPMELEYTLSDAHTLDMESVFLLTIQREEFVTGQEWDTVTRIAFRWGEEKTQEVLNKLPKELYELNAQEILEYLTSDMAGS